eukprot:10768417-Alexandrium_andersonii.AAC.1
MDEEAPWRPPSAGRRSPCSMSMNCSPIHEGGLSSARMRAPKLCSRVLLVARKRTYRTGAKQQKSGSATWTTCLLYTSPSPRD